MNALGMRGGSRVPIRETVLDFADQPVGDQPLVETFRLLALQVRNALQEMRRHSIVVMSAHPSDGRSLVATALAKALVPLGESVLIIDADLVGAGLPNNGFLPNWPDGNASGDGKGQPHVPAVSRYKIDSRRRSQVEVVSDVQQVLDAAAMLRTIAIIDTPPCLSSSLAFNVASVAGAVLYVARRNVEDASVHQEIRGQLDRLGANVLGVVFNEM